MALDREKAKLRGYAAVRREAADPAAGCDDTVAWYDDREGVSRKGLPHGPRCLAFTKPCRQIAVRERRARWDPARNLIDAAPERRQAIHIERHGGEVARRATNERADALDRTPHIGRRRCFMRTRKPPQDAGPGRTLVRLWKLDAGDAPTAPRNRASANLRVEERETVCRHAQDCSIHRSAKLGESCSQPRSPPTKDGTHSPTSRHTVGRAVAPSRASPGDVLGDRGILDPDDRARFRV